MAANDPKDTAGTYGGAVGNWGNGLGTRTAKNSFKTVFFNFREYVYFFAALFLIQVMFWTLCFTVSTNIRNEYEAVNRLYSYHMAVEEINQSEKAQIDNALFIKSVQNSRGYESYKILPPDAFNDYYTIRVRLNRSSEAELFLKYYIDSTGVGRDNVKVSYSPLYTFADSYVRSNITNGILAALLLTIMSAILLMALYSIRINHYKFLYGIYMTCGAGFKKLFSTAVWEMMVISATTLVLSYLFSLSLACLIYLPGGVGVHLYGWMVPVVVALNLITVFLAVRMPMRHMSKKAPVTLITAQDNSNLVSSPRRSFIIFGKSFPFGYELYSTWRFRRYFARTLLTAVIFTSIFVSGTYIASISKEKIEAAAPEISVRIDIGDVDFTGKKADLFSPDDVSDVMAMIGQYTIAETEGVSLVLWENSEAATSSVSHILVGGGNVLNNTEYVIKNQSSGGYEYAANSFSFAVCDRQYIDYLVGKYEIEGNPYDVLNDPGKIIISDKILGASHFRFIPGDKINLSQLVMKKKPMPDIIYSRDIDILRDQLNCYEFDYIEYEVAAVIHDNYVDGRLLLGMNIDRYYMATGSRAISDSLRVWLDKGTDSKAAADIVKEIKYNLHRDLDNLFIGFTVNNNYSALNYELLSMRRTSPSIITVSLLLLMLSPVVWFFSQILFYRKREKEIGLLRMFGADERSLSGVYTYAGLIMSALAMLATLPLSFFANYTVYKVLTDYLPRYGFTHDAGYTYSLSWTALAAALTVSVACGFLSSYIPYRLGCKRREREYARQLSELN